MALHHSCIRAIFLALSFTLLSSFICLFIEVEYSIRLINTAVLCASFNSFLSILFAKELSLASFFLGIGVKLFSGNIVTILLAFLLILLKSFLLRQFSKFCGLFNDCLLLSFRLFCSWIFFK